MKNILSSVFLSFFARVFSGVDIPREFGADIPCELESARFSSIASQLATALPAVPTSTPSGFQSAGGVPSITAEIALISALDSGCDTPGFCNIGYFGTWFVYDRQFKPSDLIVSQWTHLLVGFWNIGAGGQIYLTDPWSDFEMKTLGDASDQSGAVNGVFEQVF
ncbi:hypothetical protein TWF481_002941 [Arthrobotrys musiformis]|uniref:GH18 domain-containing protein n=1 Tax=Arthrobotrys musiformis TaxID=47236 RepID=A0AAV9VTN7_9PEZI